jgi:hypothetical protein
MDLLAILAIVAFVALAVVFAIVLRRASLVFGETRRAAAFRDDIAEVVERVDGDLGAMADLVDDVRRQEVPPPEEERFGVTFAAARDSVAWGRERIRGLAPPGGLEEARTAFLDAFGRADEALRSLEHGFAVIGSTPTGPRALEGRTAIKRGFLGLVHVREDLAAVASRVAAWRSVGERRWAAGRQRGANHRM